MLWVLAKGCEMSEYIDGFKGILIEVSDEPMFDLHYRVPGWECLTCGWRVGSQGEPPPHECPTEGIQQHCKHTWGETLPLEDKERRRDIVYRECETCHKREYRFVDSRWLD